MLTLHCLGCKGAHHLIPFNMLLTATTCVGPFRTCTCRGNMNTGLHHTHQYWFDNFLSPSDGVMLISFFRPYAVHKHVCLHHVSSPMRCMFICVSMPMALIKPSGALHEDSRREVNKCMLNFGQAHACTTSLYCLEMSDRYATAEA